MWDLLKENYKSKVKKNVSALSDEMSAVKLRDCENVQEYTSKMQRYVNDVNLCANSSTGSGTMPKSKHTYYLIKGIPKDDDWRFMTQLMYDKSDTRPANPDEIVMMMRVHAAQLQQDDDSVVAALFGMIRTMSNEWRKCWKSRKSHDGGSERDIS